MKRHLHFFILLLSTAMMVAVVAGCSPMARLNRLQRNHTYLFRNDTVVVNDTLVVPARSIDHVAALPVGKDTVIIFRNHQSKMSGRLQLRYVYDSVKVSVAATAEADTVPYQKAIYINQQPLPMTPQPPRNGALWVGIAIGILGFVLIKYLTR